eukprot:735255-Ditylum_brightwellii.AAC.1
MSLATFLDSASYLKAGIDVLCDDHWEKCYNLSLQLHSLYAEAEYCNGHSKEVALAVDVVIMHARSSNDKVLIYALLIKLLAAENKLYEAMQIGFDVLKALGVPFPSLLPDKSNA